MRRSLILTLLLALVLCMPLALYAQDQSQAQSPGSAVASAFSQGDSLTAAKNHEGAAKAYWTIVEAYPTDPRAPEAAMKYAKAVESLGDDDRSIGAYRQALAAYPKSDYAPGMKWSVALIQSHKKDHTAAAKEFEELAVTYPDSPLAPDAQICSGHQRIGMISSKLTNHDNWVLKEEADAAWKKTTELFPKNTAKCAEAELYRAGIAFERASAKITTWDVAIQQIRGVKASYPDAPKWILARLDLMQAERTRADGDDKAAAAQLDALVKAYPDCKLEIGWANYVAGNSYEDLGDFTTALARYQAVVNGNYTQKDNFRDRDVALYCLLQSGECYEKLGQTDKAREIWQSVLVKYPDAPKAEMARNRLKQISGVN